MSGDFFPGVSFARPEDEDEVFDMLRDMYKESGLLALSEKKVRDTIKRTTQQKDGQYGFIGVIRGDKIEASVGLVLDQWWYSDDWCLGERWCFVQPEFRRKNHARRLVDFSKWCAEKLHVPLAMSVLSTIRTEAKERLFRRKLTHVGGIFMYRSDGPVVTGDM